MFPSLADFEARFDDESETPDRINRSLLHRKYCHKPDCEFTRFYDGESADIDKFKDRHRGYCHQPCCEATGEEEADGSSNGTEDTYVDGDSLDIDEA